MTENTTLIYAQFEQEEQGIEDVQREPSGQYKSTKVIKGGLLLINRNGKTYNAQGKLTD